MSRGQKILIISVSYATAGMLGVYLAVFNSTILPIADSFNKNAAEMGLMISMYFFGISLAPLLIGLLSGRIGKKKLLIISYALMILGMALVGVTRSFASYFVSVFIVGAGFSITEASTTAVLSDEFIDTARRHLNFSQVFFSAGAVAGPFIVQRLISGGAAPRQLYLFCAALFLLLYICFIFTKPRNDKGEAPARGFNPVKLLKNKVFLFLALSICIYVGLESTISNFADKYCRLVLADPALSAVTIAVFWGAMVPSRFLAGIIKTDMKKVIVGLSVLILASAVGAMLIPNAAAKIVMFALCGFGCGPIWPILMNTAAQDNKGTAGPAVSIMMSFSGLGGTVLPLIAGAAIDATNHTSTAFYFSAAAVLVMLAMYLLSLKKRAAASLPR